MNPYRCGQVQMGSSLSQAGSRIQHCSSRYGNASQRSSPTAKCHEIEKEFEKVIGISLERWLSGEFFKHHISQFKKRPIAWQLSSNPSGTAGGKNKVKGSRREPVFSCLVYYHKINVDILHKIRTQYVGDLINRYGTELKALEGRETPTGDQATRKVQLSNWIAELNDFSKALQDVA